MIFGWDWEGRYPTQRHDPVRGDKGINEPFANINLGKNQIVKVWVEDSIPSDKVYNLRSDWPDALYHSATFVCWQLQIGIEEPPPIQDCDQLKLDYLQLQRKHNELISKIKEIIK